MNSPIYYWQGNAAKTKIIREILDSLGSSQTALIFDYGCGTGGDWPAILRDYAYLRLIGYEPNSRSYAAAKERLRPYDAQLYTGDELNRITFEADYIISFSVFEHVYDRIAYLNTAKRHLKADGVFYLSYDDGHFRNLLHLNQPQRWFGDFKAWLHNLLAVPLAKVGHITTFQKRVIRKEVDALIRQMEFEVVQAYYSNMSALKGLYDLIPPERRTAFTQFWLDIEERLNQDFLSEGSITLGDSANLWKVMGIRSLVLKKSS